MICLIIVLSIGYFLYGLVDWNKRVHAALDHMDTVNEIIDTPVGQEALRELDKEFPGVAALHKTGCQTKGLHMVGECQVPPEGPIASPPRPHKPRYHWTLEEMGFILDRADQLWRHKNHHVVLDDIDVRRLSCDLDRLMCYAYDKLKEKRPKQGLCLPLGE